MNFDRRLGAQHPNAGRNTQHKTISKKGAAFGTCLYLAHPVQFSLVQESKTTVTNNEKDVSFGSSSTSSQTLPSTYPTVWEHQGIMYQYLGT